MQRARGRRESWFVRRVRVLRTLCHVDTCEKTIAARERGVRSCMANVRLIQLGAKRGMISL
jgi:hypothetical protein